MIANKKIIGKITMAICMTVSNPVNQPVRPSSVPYTSPTGSSSGTTGNGQTWSIVTTPSDVMRLSSTVPNSPANLFASLNYQVLLSA